MNLYTCQEKIIRKLRSSFLRFARKYGFSFLLYPAYWHSLLFSNSKTGRSGLYLCAKPNPGAGIGHQLANWNAGFWFAEFFGLAFAHIPFSTDKWENFLGFGNDEETLENLIKCRGYTLVRLPLFNERVNKEVKAIQKIIASYAGNKVVLICEQDQYYFDQFGVKNALQEKFYAAESRKKDVLRFDSSHINVALHIRRGDIAIANQMKNSSLLARWQDVDYFEKTLDQVLAKVKTSSQVSIYLFSQGTRDEFAAFEKYENLTWCLDMGAQESFLHMVKADILITSKSSFSYKPALLNKGIKVSPRNFWHGYPDVIDWILVGDDGSWGDDKEGMWEMYRG